ncbi:hypothetical protein CRYUN_Cryun01aG0185600 [Craigia yunnanensis]
MDVAALALNQQLLCFSNPKTRAKSRPWFPKKATLLNSQKKAHVFIVCCSSSPTSQSQEANTQTRESCVNLGLYLFSKGRCAIQGAKSCWFMTLMQIPPGSMNSKLYLGKLRLNSGLIDFHNNAPSKGETKKAAGCLRSALRDYNLKFGTILNDPDLASLRASPEFKELQEEARLGGEDIAYSFRRDLKLISEVQAPFRGVRRFFYVAFSTAAGISLFFTVPRLFCVIKGGNGSPDFGETASNAAIVLEHILIEGWIQVILAGDKESASLAIQKAERFRTELLRQSVLLVPIIWGEGRTLQVEKKDFGLSPKAADTLPYIGVTLSLCSAVLVMVKAEIRFKAEVVSPEEWERDQQKSEGVTPGEDVYIILQLDGRVRRSGKGMPDWSQIVKELPPMEALLSKLER